MDQQDDRDRATSSADSEQLQPQQQQQQKGQRFDPAETGQASYGNSGGQTEDPVHGQAHGQSSANQAGLDDGATTDQADRGPTGSTSAQRSGGQTQGGHGMGNESFAGSSLGGQAGSPDASAEPRADSSATYIDPVTGQSDDPTFAPEGRGAPDPAAAPAGTARDPAKPSDLDGE